MRHSESGQATVEYVGVLALLVIVLTGAAVAIAAPDLPQAVYTKMRLALCIVGGDVCTSADARAQGLDPCVTDSEDHTEHHGMTIAFIHTNRGGAYVVEHLSDGTVRVMRSKDWGLAGTVGIELNAAVVDVGGSVSAGGTFRPGKVWDMTEAEYDALVARSGKDDSDYSDFDDVLDHHFPKPTAEFKAFGADSNAELEAKLGGVSLGSIGMASHRELGFRDNPDGTSSVFFDVRGQVAGVLSELAPVDYDADVLAEWRTSDPPHLTLRITHAGPAKGQSEEIVAGLTLSDPALRDQALRAMVGSAVAGGVAFRGLAGAIRAQGSVERYRYADTAKSSTTDIGFKVGGGLGVDGSTTSVYRRLVDAEVLNGAVPGRRVDCLAAGA
jgi:hypothetical protein